MIDSMITRRTPVLRASFASVVNVGLILADFKSFIAHDHLHENGLMWGHQTRAGMIRARL